MKNIQLRHINSLFKKAHNALSNFTNSITDDEVKNVSFEDSFEVNYLLEKVVAGEACEEDITAIFKLLSLEKIQSIV